jgi:hypothetical protein
MKYNLAKFSTAALNVNPAMTMLDIEILHRLQTDFEKDP